MTPPRSIDAWRRAALMSQQRAHQARVAADRRARARSLLRRALAVMLLAGVAVAAYVLIAGAAS